MNVFSIKSFEASASLVLKRISSIYAPGISFSGCSVNISTPIFLISSSVSVSSATSCARSKSSKELLFSSFIRLLLLFLIKSSRYTRLISSILAFLFILSSYGTELNLSNSSDISSCLASVVREAGLIQYFMLLSSFPPFTLYTTLGA